MSSSAIKSMAYWMQPGRLPLTPDFPDEPLTLAQELRENTLFSGVFARFLPS